MAKVLDYRSIPKLIAANGKDVKVAGAKTLNTIAFDSLKPLVSDAEKAMDFKKDARRALGWRVTRASTANLEAEVWTNRGWLVYHLSEGTRTPQQGWVYRGRKYILVPKADVRQKFYTRKGRLKSSIMSRIFISPTKGGDALVIFRGRRKKETILIGFLEQSVKFHEDITPHKTINSVFIKKANRLMNFYLDQEARRSSAQRR